MPSHGMPPGFGPDDPVAGDRAETDYATVGFKVTQYSPRPTDGVAHPWIMIEIDQPGLKVLKAGDAFLGLVCREGVSFEEASALANTLDRLIEGVSCTKFIT